jgi:hypothetical protein
MFNADSAWAALTRQVAFGPRVPGSPAHRACGEWLAAELEARGGRVSIDNFTYEEKDGPVWPLVNILARFGPEGPGRILLVAHWDSRPWAEMDPDSTRRMDPIPGANDGASGVAVLLEVARLIGEADLPRGVDILFTDGEDLGHAPDRTGYARGARRFATRGLNDYWRGVVLDMVGDAELKLPVEAYSLARAPEVVDWVWARGAELSPEVFLSTIGPGVFDDHMPLIDAGLPTADLIDMEYAVWHTTRDDLDAVSRRSLEAVGRVVLSLALRP